ncbi:MAG: bifunctional heptose 7-phosphate kinase/heptose 1-phosphate adenyltransferase [Schlesneria sp.]|nr:bifunctional heptose 7-phosphate kinase/heptose 1-phosphate adenyltransferase [Schlesneria sp.]
MNNFENQPASPLPSPLSVAARVADEVATPAPITVFTNGCFDLFHYGHVDFLRRCRAMGTRLIVGLNTDASIQRLKGPERPIISQRWRQGIVAACRYVDEVHLFEDDTPSNLIERLRPDIIVKGPGYSAAKMPEAALAQTYGAKVVILDGLPISTTGIITRILANA